MYNKYLDTFLSVAETGSFSRAAEASHISRTALIQQINNLEDHLGFNLLNRSSRGTELTPMGRLFEERARKIKQLSSETIVQCRELQGTRQVRIGILPNLPLTILTPICVEYAKLYPEVKITFVERQAPEYLAAFYNNEFDISADYMSRLVSSEREICFAKLTSDRFDCAVLPSSPLAQKEKIVPEELAGQKVGLLVTKLAQPEDNLRSYLLDHVQGIQIVDVESYKKSLPLTCILENMFLLHYHLNEKEYLPLVSKPLDIGVELSIEVGLCYKPDTNREVRSFINFAQTYCAVNS